MESLKKKEMCVVEAAGLSGKKTKRNHTWCSKVVQKEEKQNYIHTGHKMYLAAGEKQHSKSTRNATILFCIVFPSCVSIARDSFMKKRKRKMKPSNSCSDGAGDPVVAAVQDRPSTRLSF